MHLCRIWAVPMICWSKNLYPSVFSFSHSWLPYSLPLQAPDKHGLTPLISACFEGHLSCVKVLLEKVGTLMWACIHACMHIHASTHRNALVSFTHQCMLMCQRLHVSHECWWGNSLDKGLLTQSCGGCAGMFIEHHSIAAVHLFCVCLCF